MYISEIVQEYGAIWFRIIVECLTTFLAIGDSQTPHVQHPHRECGQFAQLPVVVFVATFKEFVMLIE